MVSEGENDLHTKHQEFINFCSKIKESDNNSLKILESYSYFSYYIIDHIKYDTRVFTITYSDDTQETFTYEIDKYPEDYLIVNRQLVLKSNPHH